MAKHIELSIHNIFGEKTEDTVYSLWLGRCGAFTRDDLIFKTKSWIEMKDFLERVQVEDDMAGRYYYISQSMTEQDIAKYINPSKEELDDLDTEYSAWVD